MARRVFGTVQRRKRPDGSHKPGYYCRFEWEGRRHVRAGGPTKKHARDKLAEAHGLLAAGVPVADALSTVFGDFDGARLSFADAVPLYLEYAKPRKRLTTFARDVQRFDYLLETPWASEYLSRITAQILTRHASGRLAEGAKPATVNREMALVSALFKWAAVMGYVEGNPCKLVERPSERDSGREVYLTAPESRTLLRAAQGPFRDVLAFALGTGCRRGEIVGLKWRAVRLGETPEESTVTVEPETAKTGTGRTLPVSPALYAMLKRRHAARTLPNLHGEDRVFTDEHGTPLTLHAVRAGLDDAKAAVKSDAEEEGREPTDEECEALTRFRAKLATFRFHDARHTAASLMVAAGVPLFDVAKLLGHKTLAMTMRYAHFAPEAGRSAVNALGAALASGA